MSSILEAQIDFLGQQVDALPQEDHDSPQIDDAISVALSFFDRIRATASQLAPEANVSLVTHWLRSAEAILPLIREKKGMDIDRFSSMSLCGRFLRLAHF